VWPLLHLPSFEAVLGPKTDRWLVRTVAGLMIVNGAVQVSVGSSAEALQQARRIGIGTALTLGTIDLVYAPRGRISKVYLIDALLEGAWILAWFHVRGRTPGTPIANRAHRSLRTRWIPYAFAHGFPNLPWVISSNFRIGDVHTFSEYRGSVPQRHHRHVWSDD
jgi:hypothetical protein